MECEIPSCTCICHVYNLQQPNIKDLLMRELEKEMAADNGESYSTHMVEHPSRVDNLRMNNLDANDRCANDQSKDTTSYFSDQDDLWERRRRLHSGAEKPLSHDDYRTQLPKMEDVQRIYGVEVQPNKLPPAPVLKKSPAHIPQQAHTPKQSALAQSVQSQVQSSVQSPVQSALENKVSQQSALAQSVQQSLQSEFNNPSIPKPTVLNPLHKYKIKERDQIIRTIYTKAFNDIKQRYKNLDTTSKEFHEYVNTEADRQLDIWLQSNK